MNLVFDISALVAVVATLLAITRLNGVHALLNLIVSLLAVALVFFTFGAPFIAALEVIIYAGAIMVLFLFVVMMLNLGPDAMAQEKRWMPASAWIAPAILSAILLAEVIYVLAEPGGRNPQVVSIDPKQVGIALYGPYLLGVELASLLLLSGLIGACHLGRRDPESEGKL
jgi:NADH-quinone oxidoreductase subunit J